jgi:hypothetical protein
MMPTGKFEDTAEYCEAAISARLRAAIRYSLAQSLASYFPPPEEPPPELRALLKRLDEMQAASLGDPHFDFRD